MHVLVDVKKPIEAYHIQSGKVVPMQYAKTITNMLGGFETRASPCPTTSNTSWFPDGEDYCNHKVWRIRNVVESEDKSLKEQADRWRYLYSEMQAIRNLMEKEGLKLTFSGQPSMSFTKDPSLYTFKGVVTTVREY